MIALQDWKLSICVLASGSKGNAVFISNGTTAVLIDAGLSGKEIERRMGSKGLHPNTLNAILVTHEHHDHIHGVGVLSRRYKIPIFINPKTEKAASHLLGKIDNKHHFECGRSFEIGGLSFHPFSISHDAMDPTAFTVKSDGTKVGIATDLGVASKLVETHLQNCSLLVLEANHDPKMLENGPYPWPLKQRVSGRTGHLSNEASRTLLRTVLHDRLQHVILAHLSEVNNTPQKALNTVSRGLAAKNLSVCTADQHLGSDLFRV